MTWTLLKITATVETEKGTLSFDFSNQELTKKYERDDFPLITMQDFIDKIGEKVLEHERT